MAKIYIYIWPNQWVGHGQVMWCVYIQFMMLMMALNIKKSGFYNQNCWVYNWNFGLVCRGFVEDPTSDTVPACAKLPKLINAHTQQCRRGWILVYNRTPCEPEVVRSTPEWALLSRGWMDESTLQLQCIVWHGTGWPGHFHAPAIQSPVTGKIWIFSGCWCTVYKTDQKLIHIGLL